ncbi:MAG: citrate/2-methylcitrate synthase [Candidatus Binatales bacterium]
MFAKEGLEGVVAARTSICLIKGAEGSKAALEYRGYSIHDLANHCGFEEVAYLLWYGALPSADELRDFSRLMRANRTLPVRVSRALASILRDLTPIDALRTAVSILSADDPDTADNSPAANVRKGVRLTAQMPSIVGAHHRLAMGLKPLAPDSTLNHAANFLYLVKGKRPRELEARALEAAMILEADHGLNPSTFAARVAAGTLADLHSAVVAALATLKGPLHGGAAAQVLAMLHAVGDASNAAGFVRKALAAHTHVAGFGHRIYKGDDPRAIDLKRWCERLAGKGEALRLFDCAKAIEREVRKRVPIAPNVDFYAAPLWSMLGFQPDTFAPVFACARIAGWVAHVAEQHIDNRLIRPEEEYIGPLSRPFIPIDQR